jgi:CHAT domain-containing protein/tetratricopeptide (TPR) repeat protein
MLVAQPADFDARVQAAASLERSGNLDAAMEAYRALLQAAPDEGRRAEMLVALALGYNRKGDYDTAKRHATEAADTFKRHGNPGREASARNVVGLAELYSGNYRAARAIFQEAAGLAERAGDAAGLAELLSNLGNAFFFLGRYDDATRAYAAALSVVERHRNAPWVRRRERLVRLNQAAVHQRLGRYQNALTLYREDAADDSLRPDEHAQGLVNQGALYRRLGDPVKALATYAEAERLFAEARHADGELGALINRGIVYALDLHDIDAARRIFSQAAARAERAGSRREWLHAELYRAEAELRAGRLDAAKRGFEASLAMATELRIPEETWKTLYGLGRVAARAGSPAEASQLFERAIAVIEGLREDLRLGAARVDFFQDKREVYDALIDLKIEDANVGELFPLMERARARGWRERLGLAAGISLAQVQQALDADAVLLEYWSSPLGTAVAYIRRSQAGVIRLHRADEATIVRLARDLSDPEREWEAAADALAGMLVPQGVITDDVRHIIVVPDGVLSIVPFDALRINGAPLVTRAAISQTPTSATLRPESNRARSLRAPWSTTLTVFADPVYVGAAGDREAPPMLPATSTEAAAIRSEVGGQTRMYLREANVRTRFVQREVAHTPLLHVASHALVHEPLEGSRILFSSESDAHTPEAVFLREIYDLKLEGTELVVLSACDTGRGELVRGEGVQSFGRAFLAAGAESVITTLWKVPDEAPVDLMRVLYDRLQRGDGRAEALRRAKLAMLDSGDRRAHPFYWAGYVLTGATGPITRALRWSDLVSVLLGAAAVAVLIVAVRRRR